MTVLDLRQLNRATLARQCLLERATDGIEDVVHRCSGLQAQAPTAPALGLWSRAADFTLDDLVDAARSHRLVRGTTMRGTIHLHTAADYRALRPTMQPMLDSLLRSMRRRVREQDIEPALAAGRELLDGGPVTVAELKALLAERFPDSQAQALANVVRLTEPLLFAPDGDAPLGWKTNAPFARAASFVGELGSGMPLENVVRRFFAALGPGTVKDVQTWTSMRGLKDIVRGMVDRGELLTLDTYDGGEVFDLPDAPRPDGDTPAGVRFLPTWDNVLLSHADRSRVIDPAYRPALASKNGMPPTTYLVDGFVHGTWKIERERDTATLQLTRFTELPSRFEDAVVREGEALLGFLEPDAVECGVEIS